MGSNPEVQLDSIFYLFLDLKYTISVICIAKATIIGTKPGESLLEELSVSIGGKAQDIVHPKRLRT